MSPGGEYPSRGSCDSAREPVSRILFYAVIPLGAALLRTLISDLPGGFGNSSSRLAASGRCAAEAWPLASASLPIWSCSVWGLPCLRPYGRSGALLPHLFTLTTAWGSPLDESIGRPAYPLTRIAEAVCFLWHWPSTSLKARVPDVIRHTALRSSDFPPPAGFARAKTTGSDRPVLLPALVYRENEFKPLSCRFAADLTRLDLGAL